MRVMNSCIWELSRSKNLDYSLAAVEEKRTGECYETFALWGVRNVW